MAESNLKSYKEWVQSLKDMGFGGLVDELKLEDYVKSINTPPKTDLPTQNTTSKNETKNEEEAVALPPGGLLLPIEVV